MNSNGSQDEENFKDNTDKALEPRKAQHEDRLAKGNIGPNMGGIHFSQNTQNLIVEDRSHEKLKENEADKRPSFERTGDREVDQFYSKDNRMITKDDDREH